MDMTFTEMMDAVIDLSGALNRLTDVALSGTPRVCLSQSYYFKVYSDVAGTETPPYNPAAWKTYDDTTLSGAPLLLAFAVAGELYFLKGYSVIADILNPTHDLVQNLVTVFDDDVIMGETVTFRMFSGASSYYFKAYKQTGVYEPTVTPDPEEPPITPEGQTLTTEEQITPTTEARDAVRVLLADDDDALCSDAEILSWLSLAAIDVSAKTLCCRENNTLYVPVNDLTGALNQLADETLSGTPRVCVAQSCYFKVFPDRAVPGTPSLDPEAWQTCDDTGLSGTPQRLGFAFNGDLYWVKGYTVATAVDNPTADPVQYLPFAVPDDAVAGPPAVFELLSGGDYYYFKAYQLYGYAVCDDLLTLPLPTGTLKLLAVLRTTAGGSPQGLMRVHPRILGRLPGGGAGDPRFFFEFAGELGLMPGGGDAGLKLNLYRAYLTDTFEALPDDLQPSAIIYAYVLALYKAFKFETAAMVYQQYLSNIFQIRGSIYETGRDNKADAMLPDRKELVR